MLYVDGRSMPYSLLFWALPHGRRRDGRCSLVNGWSTLYRKDFSALLQRQRDGGRRSLIRVVYRVNRTMTQYKTVSIVLCHLYKKKAIHPGLWTGWKTGASYYTICGRKKVIRPTLDRLKNRGATRLENRSVIIYHLYKKKAIRPGLERLVEEHVCLCKSVFICPIW